MDDSPVGWSDGVDEVIRGDLTAAVAYLTPSGGVVVTAVSPCLYEVRRDKGVVGFTTSLGFGRKLERIVADPRVALAFHTREHGLSTNPSFVLAQGVASVDLAPSPQRLQAALPQVERFFGAVKRGPVWDRLLHEYYLERVFIDVAVKRILAWTNLAAAGDPHVIGAARPEGPLSQTPPQNGTGPRVDIKKTAGRMAMLPHRLIGYQGADGLPVVVPVELAGHDNSGLRLVTSAGLLPVGSRRAGLLAHAFRPQLIGLSTRTLTGWLEVDGDGAAIYAPHTSRGFIAPHNKNLLLVTNGLLAKVGMWQAERKGLAARLERLAADRAGDAIASSPRSPE